MESNSEKFKNYQKNLRYIQEATEKLLSHMKGHGFSFRPEITDKKGDFSQEKLCSLVEELMSYWASKWRDYADMDPSTGKSLAEPYLQDRLELYGLYFYLVMRCTLHQGAYSDVWDREMKERTDFAFLLEQAKRLSQSWCVMTNPKGEKTNELYEGYDRHFGFHLYHKLADPDGISDDFALTPWYYSPMQDSSFLTNEGNMKRIFLSHSSFRRRNKTASEAAEPEPEKAVPAEEEAQDVTDSADSYEDDSYEDYNDYEDSGEDDFDLEDYYEDYPFDLSEDALEAEWEERSERDAREYRVYMHCLHFECRDEYMDACRRFKELFKEAKPEVLRGFYEELEGIVDLYLAEHGIAPLTDTDRTLDVYNRICSGPCRQAKRYERGQQWRNL